MADNDVALKKLFDQAELLDQDKITVASFIDNCEKILFNDASSSTVEYFSDGWRAGSASNIIKYVLKAYAGDEQAMHRLKVDFGVVDCNIEVKEM